jgi:hypothetical protein
MPHSETYREHKFSVHKKEYSVQAERQSVVQGRRGHPTSIGVEPRSTLAKCSV